jgi:streptomycin 6-kinase
MVAVFARRVRLIRSRLPTVDVIRARRLLARTALPLATSHGDFHGGNVLFDGEATWVVDWELCGRRPIGYDLMQLWADFADERDRTRLFAGAAEIAGGAWIDELRRLRYALLVITIANKLTSERPFDRDPVGADALLRLLPEARAEARL